MKSLSQAQARRCERATTPRCKCRCGGRFHGAKRADDVRTLPADDPHRPAEPRPRRPRGPVDRATRQLDKQLERIGQQLDVFDAAMASYRKNFCGGEP
jgi:hypothetical protein